MFLKNPFSLDTRYLFFGVWSCWICGQNGSQRGGLELHHIMGRNSDSPLNASLVCKVCHEKLNHNQEEEQMLFFKTMRYLKSIHYQLTSQDMYFMEDNKKRLFSPEFIEWVNKP